MVFKSERPSERLRPSKKTRMWFFQTASVCVLQAVRRCSVADHLPVAVCVDFHISGIAAEDVARHIGGQAGGGEVVVAEQADYLGRQLVVVVAAAGGEGLSDLCLQGAVGGVNHQGHGVDVFVPNARCGVFVVDELAVVGGVDENPVAAARALQVLEDFVADGVGLADGVVVFVGLRGRAEYLLLRFEQLAVGHMRAPLVEDDEMPALRQVGFFELFDEVFVGHAFFRAESEAAGVGEAVDPLHAQQVHYPHFAFGLGAVEVVGVALFFGQAHQGGVAARYLHEAVGAGTALNSMGRATRAYLALGLMLRVSFVRAAMAADTTIAAKNRMSAAGRPLRFCSKALGRVDNQHFGGFSVLKRHLRR